MAVSFASLKGWLGGYTAGQDDVLHKQLYRDAQKVECWRDLDESPQSPVGSQSVGTPIEDEEGGSEDRGMVGWEIIS